LVEEEAGAAKADAPVEAPVDAEV
ncbi:MAG: hypothetical protein QOG01_2450, partial [Pseudonocardiales bacterium]|nr:hypothetical protein [Pseudonocardiales bacterium]